MTRPERTLRPTLFPVGLYFISFVSVAMILVAPPRAGAISSEGCRSGGTSFEILDPSDESGIGGTGLAPDLPPRTPTRMADEFQSTPARSEDGSESGIGGTGRSPDPSDDDESGIGGTGIFGPITAKRLDRICVNGLEIGLSKRPTIQTANGTTSSDQTGEQGLEVGTVVWIEATPTGEGLVAERIEIAPTLSGRVEALRRDGRGLVVAGQQVRLPDTALPGPIPGAEELRPGDRVRVHGLRNPAGEWVASRIEPAENEPGDQPDPGEPTPAMTFSIAKWLARHPHPRFLSIEGYVESRRDADGTLRLMGIPLEFGSDTPGESPERPRPGAWVRATGRLTPEGELQIERLPRSFRPMPLESNTPPPSLPSRDAQTKRSAPSEKMRPRPPRSDDIDRSWKEVPKRPERPPHRPRPVRRPPRPPLDRRHP